MAKSRSYLCLLALTVFLGTTCSGATSVKGDYGTDVDVKLDERPKEAWPWEKVKFKCPSMNGVFANTEDCSSFFLCVMGISSKRNCPRFTKFDKYQKKCLASIIAICDRGVTTESPDDTTKSKETTISDGTTTAKDTFLCPSVFGTFVHPTECNKYYTCAIFIPSLKTCSKEELFDGVKLKCKKAKNVDCGSRSKPTETPVLTTLPSTPEPETTTTPNPDTTTVSTEATPNPDTTTPSPETTTTPEPTTSPTPEPTTPEKPTKPTGPPETSCDENDLDCIIDDTGVTPDWFTCPEDIGSYPHPSSIKLFIFCINWQPSVKKCGQDMVYSTELRTCVDP